MKVFISWSGETSKKAATILHEWLPSVLQNVSPYMSAENIEKGERWSIDISSQLQETNYGIICVTPENVAAPWILFESGALSKSMQNSRVSPIIFGLDPSDLTNSPLLQFQLTRFLKNDISKLLLSINSSAPDSEKVGSEIVNKAFSRAWDELEQSMANIKFEKSAGSKPHAGKDISSIETAVQEILTNTRSQLKILSSSDLGSLSRLDSLLEVVLAMNKASTLSVSGRDVDLSSIFDRLDKSLVDIRLLEEVLELHQADRSMKLSEVVKSIHKDIRPLVDALKQRLLDAQKIIANRMYGKSSYLMTK